MEISIYYKSLHVKKVSKVAAYTGRDLWGKQSGIMIIFIFVFSINRCSCCLPTPLTLARGGSPIFPLVVHQPISPPIWPSIPSIHRGCPHIQG